MAKWITVIIVVAVIVGALAYLGGRKVAPVEEVVKEVPVPTEGPVIVKSVGTLDVRYTESDGRLVPARIYFPRGEIDKKYPGIVFCGGYIGFNEMYHLIPREIAKHGYVTMIFKPTREEWFYSCAVKGASGEWAKDMEDAITYLTQESSAKDMVDLNRLGIIGHSLGGITTSKVAADDPRVKAGVLLSCADLSKLKETEIPLQIQTADFDLGPLASVLNVPAFYAANPPKQLIVIQGGTHDGLTSILDPYWPKPSWENPIEFYYAIAWFDYFLKGDESALEKIITPTEHLSKAWYSMYDLGEGKVKMSGPLMRPEKLITLGEVAEDLGIEPIGYKLGGE
jgi:dienelactone hydrolase